MRVERIKLSHLRNRVPAVCANPKVFQVFELRLCWSAGTAWRGLALVNFPGLNIWKIRFWFQLTAD